MTFGFWGGGKGTLEKPCGIAVDAAMNVYVADAGNGQVQVLDPQGKLFRAFGRGEGGWLKKVGKLVVPAGIAVDATGACYETDVKRGVWVQVFDRDWRFLCVFGGEGRHNGQFNEPHGIAINGRSQVYVSDNRNNRVQRFGVA